MKWRGGLAGLDVITGILMQRRQKIEARRKVTMETDRERDWRCCAVGFEYGGRNHGPGDIGSI